MSKLTCDSSESTKTTVGRSTSSVADRMSQFRDAVGRLMCSVTGHDTLIRFDDGGMYLECMSCRWRSAGWAMEGRDAARTRIDARRS
jgi:hypothetical protein